MRVRSLATLLLATLFSSSRGLALSIPYFGITSELQILLSTLEQDAQARFLKLLTQQNREQICKSRILEPYISNETGIEVGDSLSSFWGPLTTTSWYSLCHPYFATYPLLMVIGKTLPEQFLHWSAVQL